VDEIDERYCEIPITVRLDECLLLP